MKSFHFRLRMPKASLSPTRLAMVPMPCGLRMPGPENTFVAVPKALLRSGTLLNSPVILSIASATTCTPCVMPSMTLEIVLATVSHQSARLFIPHAASDGLRLFFAPSAFDFKGVNASIRLPMARPSFLMAEAHFDMLSPIVPKVSLMVSSTPKDSKSFLKVLIHLEMPSNPFAAFDAPSPRTLMMSANVCAGFFASSKFVETVFTVSALSGVRALNRSPKAVARAPHPSAKVCTAPDSLTVCTNWLIQPATFAAFIAMPSMMLPIVLIAPLANASIPALTSSDGISFDHESASLPADSLMLSNALPQVERMPSKVD